MYTRITCCRDCEFRSCDCHSKCKTYAKEKAEWDAYRTKVHALNNNQDFAGYIMERNLQRKR